MYLSVICNYLVSQSEKPNYIFSLSPRFMTKIKNIKNEE